MSGGDSNDVLKNEEQGDFTRIDWNPPGSAAGEGVFSKNSTLALKTAIAVARAFDANCALRNPNKESTIPMFEPQELVLGGPLRSSGFFTDIQLRGIRLTKELQHGAFSEEEEEFRARFAERSAEGHYAVKFLQNGVYNSVHAASAASDFMMETKILMNLAPHPNCVQIYGVTAAGSDAFLSRGQEGFYIIVDRLSHTLTQRLNNWRDERQESREKMAANGEDGLAIAKVEYTKLMERLEIALDIASAILFLSDRQLVFNLRPEKVGFDARYGSIKLCDFGQSRENGQLDQAPSLTKSDDIRTLAYTAPEVLCQAPVTVSADVYAFGVVLYEVLSLERPFYGMSRSEHFAKVVMEGERPPIPSSFPKIAKQLVEHCWNSHLRPTMKRVYDTLEEVLLFQDDKPDLVPVQVVLPAHVGTGKSEPSLQPGASKPRRTFKKDSESDAKATKKQPTKISRQGTQKTSNQRRTATSNSKSDQDTSDNQDGAPPSPRATNGDKTASKPRTERATRKPRVKKTTSEASHDSQTSGHNSASNLPKMDVSENSLHDILDPNEDEKESKVDSSSRQKLQYKANQSMPAMSATTKEDNDDSKPQHNSFSATEPKAHKKRRPKKEHAP